MAQRKSKAVPRRELKEKKNRRIEELNTLSTQVEGQSHEYLDVYKFMMCISYDCSRRSLNECICVMVC